MYMYVYVYMHVDGKVDQITTESYPKKFTNYRALLT